MNNQAMDFSAGILKDVEAIKDVVSISRKARRKGSIRRLLNGFKRSRGRWKRMIVNRQDTKSEINSSVENSDGRCIGAESMSCYGLTAQKAYNSVS